MKYKLKGHIVGRNKITHLLCMQSRILYAETESDSQRHPIIMFLCLSEVKVGIKKI
jgi:hypothetical protein